MIASRRPLCRDPHHVMLNDSGRHVTLIQTALMEIDGADRGGRVEEELLRKEHGSRGAELQEAQEHHQLRLPKTADDIVGKMTIKELDKDMAERGPSARACYSRFPFPLSPRASSSPRATRSRIHGRTRSRRRISPCS